MVLSRLTFDFSHADNKVLSETVNSSECNEAEQMTCHRKSHANVSAEQMMRVSDASGSDEEVVLRPKSQQPNRRLARPLAVISGLFNRESGNGSSSNQEEINGQYPKPLAFYDNTDDNSKQQKKSKRSSWNIFKNLNKKKIRDSSPSFQHFAEPLNIERVSLPIGPPMDSDTEWYDLNKDEMSLFEARVSDVINEFNSGYQRVSDFESESIYRCDIGRHLTVSSNILWSHNLSLSCQSNINLLGANINKLQIHSDVFIEEGETLPQTTAYASPLNASFASTDSDGYAVMQPIPHKYIKPIMLIDDHYSSDESSNASSGFGSDSDGNSPIASTSARSTIPISRASSDSSPLAQLGACSPSVAAKPMQKASKKRRLQIKSRKLLEMLHVKPTPSQSNRNVTTTPPK